MRDIIRILIAPLVWLATFSAIYGLHGLLCGHGINGTAFGLPIERVLLGAAFLFAILLQTALLFALYHPSLAASSEFSRFVSRATGWVGLVATLWSLSPVVLTTYCV
ncbi:hypothetical protein [uncultured Sulfitobacter sp.]|uniref:hypothetical protein n=1 Tax=uncultured Sulfitobacter sp. TaxID=191468 RepID=UPI00262EA8A1|nr:hypothetical protein [uncultured Sulfitobacter sp.]